MTACLNIYVIVTIVLSLATAGYCYPSGTYHNSETAKSKCGYESCPKVYPDKLNVHIVPHSHDDVGWLKTVDQYYYGVRNDIQLAGVQYIIDTVTLALEENPDRRFIQVETAFFWKWWLEQNEDTRDRVRKLVNEGRLEFAGGGWSMNDEATTHYQSTIDQFTWALRKLNDSFGPCGRPRVGWQIDPFGHSREMASIFARMGYDGLFFARLDFEDKEQRFDTNTMELIWEGSSNLGEAADLFTSVLFDHYNSPADFCFDYLCGFTNLVDDEKSPEYNMKYTVENFISLSKFRGAYYTTNNILIPMGDDFSYQHADYYYRNLDKLIRTINKKNGSINAVYSTPSCYVKAVNDVGQTYTTKQDDFFPYATDYSSYWTGYYTSRPALKFYERFGNNFLQVGKQLTAMVHLGQSGDSPLDSLREAMGVLQHHDAVSGTEKQHVAYDYARLLYIGMEKTQEAVETALNNLMPKGTKKINLQSCLNLNVSSCDITEQQQQFVVTVYNPMSRNVTHFVRIPVPKGSYRIQDPSDSEVKFQIVPIPESVLNTPSRRAMSSNATHELVFQANNLPALGFRSYYVTRVSNTFNEVKNSTDFFIGSKDTVMVILDEKSGLIKEVITSEDRIPLKQNFYYYLNGGSMTPSGAYVFNPSDGPFEEASSAAIEVYKGDIVDEVHQQFTPSISQIVRIYKQEKHVELEWLIGLNDFQELTSMIDTKLQTESIFYTDSNGRELLQRKRNYRPTWKVVILSPTAGNYYPVTSRIVMRDTKSDLEVSFLNDRAQGGSSIKDGQLELMVHRRLCMDDGFGVGERLDEYAYDEPLVVRGKHFLVVGRRNGPSPNMAAQERILAQKKILSPWLFFSPGESSFDKWKTNFKMEYSGLTRNFPENVQILTLEPWREHELLLRLEHIMEKDEDPELSKPVEVNLQDLFTTFTITEIHETTLAGNQWIEEMKRLVWKTKNTRNRNNISPPVQDIPVVTLNPMEIRTFIIRVNRK